MNKFWPVERFLLVLGWKKFRNLQKKIGITDEIVLLFLKEGFTGQKSTILHQLILNGEVEEVEKLLNKGTSKQYFFHFSYSLAPSQVSKH